MKREREREREEGSKRKNFQLRLRLCRSRKERGEKRSQTHTTATGRDAARRERERGDKVSSSGLDFPDLLFLLPFVLFSSGSHVSVFRKEGERGMDRRKEAQSAFSRVITFLIPPVLVKSTLLPDDLRVRIVWRNRLYSSLCKLALVTEVGYMIYIDVWW